MKKERNSYLDYLNVIKFLSKGKTTKDWTKGVRVTRIAGAIEFVYTNLEIIAKYRMEDIGTPFEAILPIDRLQLLKTADFKVGLNGVITELDTDGETEQDLIDVCEVDDYPFMEIPRGEDLDTAEIYGGTLALTNCSIFAGNEKVRYALNGVWFEKDKFVGTDGRRLHIENLKISKPLHDSLILPRTLIDAVYTAKAKDISLAIYPDFNSSHLSDGLSIYVRAGDIEFFSRPVDGNYPDYESIFPTEINYSYVVDKEILKAKIRTVNKVFNSDDSPYIDLDFNGKLKIEAKKMRTTMDIETLKKATESFHTWLNPGYLLDFLNVIVEDRVVVKSYGEGKAIVLSLPDSNRMRHIVMPVEKPDDEPVAPVAVMEGVEDEVQSD